MSFLDLEGQWGIRIESCLVVRKVKVSNVFAPLEVTPSYGSPQPKNATNDQAWYGFERLTAVPIQTKMIKESMLTKEEKAWIKEHNQRCYDQLLPLIKEDKRAVKWLEREVKRDLGLAPAPGGIVIEWD